MKQQNTKMLLLACSLFAVGYTSHAQNTFPTTGNVGIGTITPADRLTVLTPSNVIGFSHSNGTVKFSTVINPSGAFVGTFTNHPLFLRTNGGPAQLTLLQSGNVGIGTITPLGKLDVRGGDTYLNGVRAGIGGGNDGENTVFGYAALQNNVGTTVVNGDLVFGGSSNTAVGNLAMNSNTYGSSNTAVGNRSMSNNTTGFYNTAMGTYALFAGNGLRNTALGAYSLSANTGFGNTAVGSQSLTSNTSGYSNTGIGQASLFTNTSGISNTGLGDNSLFYNTIGSRNTGIGGSALFLNSTGFNNTALGESSLYGNRTGNNNTSLGQGSMNFNNTGSTNTSVGVNSLYYNVSGSSNTSIGYNAMDSNTTGSQNCAGGMYAMYNSKSGNYNTAYGRYSLYNNKTGSENTAIGDVALYYTSTGGFNTGLGYFASPNSGAWSNTTALGYSASTTASNQVRIGNSSVTSIGGYASWTNISDGRVKRNIKENVPGLAFINQLKAVTYTLDLAAADNIIDKAPIKDELKKDDENEELSAARIKKEQIIYTGFIAQDVEKAAKKIDYDFSGVDAPKNDKDLYGIRYAEFVVPLVKAVQELAEENEKLKTEMTEIKAMLKANNMVAVITTASLEQNVPNPSNNSTVIHYTLPAKYISASIIITDIVGKKIKNINLSGSGKGNVLLNTSAMNAGTFQYSLYLNDRLIETKQMIIAK